HFDSIVLLAFVHQRQGRLDEALALYKRLQEMQPDNAVWAQWVKSLGERQSARPVPQRWSAVRAAPAVAAPPVPQAPAEPPLSFSSVAGEFLQDHWQKLILCLAVLLIVVSSNVGAYQLLGPRLWSPTGKCVLALVYTAMFAAFGAGLVRWGARRAGQ